MVTKMVVRYPKLRELVYPDEPEDDESDSDDERNDFFRIRHNKKSSKNKK